MYVMYICTYLCNLVKMTCRITKAMLFVFQPELREINTTLSGGRALSLCVFGSRYDFWGQGYVYTGSTDECCGTRGEAMCYMVIIYKVFSTRDEGIEIFDVRSMIMVAT